MKKLPLLITLLVITLTAFPQETQRVMGWKISHQAPQNELKLNLATSIFSSMPEITYERILHTDLSLGASALVSLEPDDNDLNLALIPYMRWFFGGNTESLQKCGAGFFIELNGALLSTDIDENVYENETYVTHSKGTTGAGLGLALGWKYLTRNNWVGELYGGAGRDFMNDDAYPRVGITIGKRF
ncbi:MAG: hypothetical protein PHH64_02840 [Proteiniphilum sp.]|nr:hypothetical protein [Proteiniphilum sp.]MDD4158329.1 hypothetical protein [Proteiniphilum sp.]MDD4799670.1 hypothetical protein [Proteiniphilum sp.]